jgi:hypothetical protein
MHYIIGAVYGFLIGAASTGLLWVYQTWKKGNTYEQFKRTGRDRSGYG